MDNAIPLLQQVLFCYLLSVTIAWFIVHLIGEKSGVPRLLKTEVIFYPAIFSMFKGLLPGMLIAVLLSQVFGVTGPISVIPVLGGTVVSGVILHRKLRSTVSHKLLSDLLIGAIFLMYTVGLALFVKEVSD